MKRKVLKFISIATTALMISSFTINSYAIGKEPIEVGPHPGHQTNNITSPYSNLLLDGEYDKLISEMMDAYRDSYVPTEEDYMAADKILELYRENFTEEYQTNSGFDDNWWLLRTGNLIEFTLDLDEGVNAIESAAMVALAEEAKESAQKNFSAYWDSAQHFMWNFKMRNQYNGTKARTIGVNHEWGIAMINDMTNYFESCYDDYVADGYSDKDASDKALADTILYMPRFKYDSVSIMEASFDYFDYYFSDDSMMDFWNNCYGRAYTTPQYTAESAYRYSAFTAKELILDGKNSTAENLTSEHKNNIWAWDWYSY